MSGTSPVLERLARGPLVCDGAMGTELYERGVSYERCFEWLNLADPEQITAIHLDYIAAGAQIIETNTFGANRFRLASHGLESKVREINRAGVSAAHAARNMSGQAIFLAGSIGPLGQPLTPAGPLRAAETRAAFREQADALLEAGIDLIIVETISDTAEMREALTVVREVSALPLVAQMTFTRDGLTTNGDDPATAARMMRESGADVVGSNCAFGPAPMLDHIRAMRLLDRDLILAAQPNAGLPARVGQGYIYPATHAHFADYTAHFLAAGVHLLGGCCGTTPRHIAAMSATLRNLAPDPALRPPLAGSPHP